MILVLLLAFAALAIALQAGLDDVLANALAGTGLLPVILLVLVAAVVGGVVWVVLRFRTMIRHYRPDGALADDLADAGRPFELRLEATADIDVLLQFSVRGERSFGSSRVRYGLTALLEVEETASPGAPPGVPLPVLRQEFVLGSGKPTGQAPTESLCGVYNYTAMNEEVSATAHLCSLPAGGPRILRGRVTYATGTEPFGATIFVKPSLRRKANPPGLES